MSTLQELLYSCGLDRVNKEIALVALPSIRLKLYQAEEPQLRIGMTKFGGSPDLPPWKRWPERNGSPLPFVAQINLSDVAPYHQVHLLPSLGIVYFFFDEEAFFESRAFDQAATWHVYYTQCAVSELQRIPIPESIPKRGRYRPSVVTCSTEMTLPDYSQYDSTSVERLGLSGSLTDEEEQAYHQLQAQLAGRVGAKYHLPIHRLLGHPDQVQWDMHRDLGGVPADWQHLLQVDSDDVPDTNWGDTGRIYYWIRSQDLAKRNFGQVQLILQST